MKFFFIGILVLAAFFRFYGVNWDQNQHLHPDERFLTMVSEGISWPKTLWEYLDASTSPLNPHNRGYGFFVYGTFPIFFTKYIAESLSLGDYTNITLVGRRLSAIFDLGTVVLVYLIARQINSNIEYRNSKQYQNSNFKNSKRSFRASDFGFRIFPLFAMFFYAVMVLPIQLSHFYAVDTYLTFFITLTFYFLTLLFQFPTQKQTILLYIATGISFGLAIASKISAVYFAPIIVLAFGFHILTHILKNHGMKTTKIQSFLLLSFTILIFFLSTYLTIRFAQPYLFAQPNLLNHALNPKVLSNLEQLTSFSDPNSWFPPGVQWIYTKPYIFPLKNMVFWGLGLPLGIFFIWSLIYVSITCLKIGIYELKKIILSPLNRSDLLVLFLALLWIVILFGYQGYQFVKAVRYFHPIYPFIAIISAYVFSNMKKITNPLKILLLILMALPALAFMSIYHYPHTRVASSEWIYQNIPAGSTIPGEHWDDFLPLSSANNSSSQYTGVEFPLYGFDTQEKWNDMYNKLNQVNYIILSSNRLYGSIMTAPEKFPVTYQYYQMLFDGRLGFEKAAQFTSRPKLPIPSIKLCIHFPGERYGIVAKSIETCSDEGISFIDDYADESFTVYDHPVVTIFKKVRSLDYQSLLKVN